MGTPFTIRHSVHGAAAELTVAGDIDVGVLQPIRDTVEHYLAERGCTSVAIDLSGVTFIDSSGLGVLVASKRLAGEAGKVLRVTGAQGRTAEIIELTGLTAHLLEHPSAE